MVSQLAVRDQAGLRHERRTTATEIDRGTEQTASLRRVREFLGRNLQAHFPERLGRHLENLRRRVLPFFGELDASEQDDQTGPHPGAGKSRSQAHRLPNSKESGGTEDRTVWRGNNFGSAKPPETGRSLTA
jgi:hypothetical protein